MNKKMMSIASAFSDAVAQFGNKPLVHVGADVQTFDMIDRASDAIAISLQERGIAKDDKIALYCINGHEFVSAYLGIIKAGAIVVPINLLINPREIDYILDDAEVKGLIYHQAMQANVDALGASLAEREILCCIGSANANANDGVELFSDWLSQSGSPQAVAIKPQDDTAVILYTSGTTGFPKGAMLTHHNLVSNTLSVVRALGLKPGADKLLLVLPMFHAFAGTVGMLTPLLHGLSLVPVTKFDPGLISELIESEKCTVFLGVPSMYGAILRLPQERVNQWKSIRFGVSGGAAMPVALMREFEERFAFPILEGDGPTECSPVTSVTRPGAVRKPASVGVAVPGVEVRILDERGEQLPCDQIGEICVRGANTMKGYWKRPEETQAVFFGEWLRTGDLGYMDADDYIFMVDRKKDLIIVNGMNVYPRMVEEVLFQHESVEEAAVVGEPDERHGEIVVAHVVVKPESELSEMDIKKWCREKLGQHQRPRKVIIRDVLPKNATGKILKRELRIEGEIERGVDNR